MQPCEITAKFIIPTSDRLGWVKSYRTSYGTSVGKAVGIGATFQIEVNLKPVVQKAGREIEGTSNSLKIICFQNPFFTGEAKRHSIRQYVTLYT